MTPEQLAHLTDAEREAWELVADSASSVWERSNVAVTEFRNALRSLAELRAAVAAAPCSGGCVPDQFGHEQQCWKSRIK